MCRLFSLLIGIVCLWVVLCNVNKCFLIVFNCFGFILKVCFVLVRVLLVFLNLIKVWLIVVEVCFSVLLVLLFLLICLCMWLRLCRVLFKWFFRLLLLFFRVFWVDCRLFSVCFVFIRNWCLFVRVFFLFLCGLSVFSLFRVWCR